jgi:hypothetical protein
LRDASGTGIGLFVVDQLATWMGGSATASAREPHGLRVVVTLPAAIVAEVSPDGLVDMAEASSAERGSAGTAVAATG